MRAFLDTTILADATLKDRATRARTLAALAECSSIQTPQYAIKEFNAGPLDHYRWWHNILAEERSFEKSIGRLSAVSRTPRKNRVSTALEAMRRSEQELSTPLTDQERAEALRLHLKRVIFTAWQVALKLGTVTDLLDCFQALGPKEIAGDLMITLGPTKCTGPECALATRFHVRLHDLGILVETIRKQPTKDENTKRLTAIAKLQKGEQIRDSECRALGDAVFAMLAPTGSIILTTNLKDHSPLAEALGKRAMLPATVRDASET